MVFQVVPPSVDLSILYPVIGEPPSFSGACQEILICDGETYGVAKPVGGCDTAKGIALASFVLGDAYAVLLRADTFVRKSVVLGKSVDLDGRRIIKKKLGAMV